MDSANFLFCCINMDEGRFLFFQHNTAKRRCHWTVSRKNAGTGRRRRATKYRSDFDERIPLSISSYNIHIFTFIFYKIFHLKSTPIRKIFSGGAVSFSFTAASDPALSALQSPAETPAALWKLILSQKTTHESAVVLLFTGNCLNFRSRFPVIYFLQQTVYIYSACSSSCVSPKRIRR